MATKPFEHDGRCYSFVKSGNEYRVIRDDGMTAWDTYPIHTFTVDGPTSPELQPATYTKVHHAYTPAFATVTECKQAIRGERPSTYYHRLVFAATAYAAAKIAEQEATDREGTANPF